MIDYTSSGLKVVLEHHLVDSRTLEDLGLLDGVVGFELAEAWRGDYRQTGTIELDGSTVPEWAAVRTFIVVSQGAETERTELCTLMPEPSDCTIRLGRGLRSVPLSSMMRKLGENLNGEDVGIPNGSSVASLFSAACNDSGAVPSVHVGLSTATTTSTRVWKAGESYLTQAHALANACNGRVQPDAHGRVCLVPYQNPVNIAESFEVPAGAASVTLIGLGVNAPEIVNKVVASYSKDDQRWFSTATVDVNHPWSFARIGRWVTLEVVPPQIESGNVQDVLDALTAQTLRAHSDTRGTYGVTLAYMPVHVGQVGTVYYKDSPQMDLMTVLGFVSQRSIRYDGINVVMELTVEEV